MADPENPRRAKILTGLRSPLPGRQNPDDPTIVTVSGVTDLASVVQQLEGKSTLCIENSDNIREGSANPRDSREANTVCGTVNMPALKQFLAEHEKLKEASGVYVPVMLDARHPQEWQSQDLDSTNVTVRSLSQFSVAALAAGNAHELGHVASPSASEADIDKYAVCLGQAEGLIEALQTVQPFASKQAAEHGPILPRIEAIRKLDSDPNKAAKCSTVKKPNGRS